MFVIASQPSRRPAALTSRLWCSPPAPLAFAPGVCGCCNYPCPRPGHWPRRTCCLRTAARPSLRRHNQPQTPTNHKLQPTTNPNPNPLPPSAKGTQVGSGVTFAQVEQAASARGQFVACGWAPTVGVAGWSIGGGHGPFGPSAGLGAWRGEQRSCRWPFALGAVAGRFVVHRSVWFWLPRGVCGGMARQRCAATAEPALRPPCSRPAFARSSRDSSHTSARLSLRGIWLGRRRW